MMGASAAETYYRVLLPSIEQRDAWRALREQPQLAPLLAAIEARAAAAPAQPPIPPATAYLAARRHNDRQPLDRHWFEDRARLSALAVRRCLAGRNDADPDDQLLDWVWGLLTEPTWVVSAHLPGHDLPASGRPTLDLAACDMAATFAEMREVLKPWMDTVSDTLADSVIAEIDTRVLGPYGAGREVRWQDAETGLNNWLGVCAGCILTACESLAAQGHPRPEARARALAGLRLYLDRCFTTHGECDEGLGYWIYGMTYACMGWSRLTREEFEANVDLDRLRLVADYPRRIHLFGDCFFSGNDAELRVAPPHGLLPWLAAATGAEGLAQWAARGGPGDDVQDFGLILRVLFAPEPGPDERPTTHDNESRRPRTDTSRSSELAVVGRSSLPRAREPVQLLQDQQVAVMRVPTPAGELLACLSGGHNGERHNHNDLGHFLIALDGQWIVPDLGAPEYTADFFGPRRYTYLPASSRGHCCPLIGGFEQRPGEEAAGRLLSWDPEAACPRLALDLTAAYPPDADLLAWTRVLEGRPAAGPAPARMVITDTFETRQGGQEITHVLWSLEPPRDRTGDGVTAGSRRLDLGPVDCEIVPPPDEVRVTAVSPEELRLHEWEGRTLYRVEAQFHTPPAGRLSIETHFFVDPTDRSRGGPGA